MIDRFDPGRLLGEDSTGKDVRKFLKEPKDLTDLEPELREKLETFQQLLFDAAKASDVLILLGQYYDIPEEIDGWYGFITKEAALKIDPEYQKSYKEKCIRWKCREDYKFVFLADNESERMKQFDDYSLQENFMKLP